MYIYILKININIFNKFLCKYYCIFYNYFIIHTSIQYNALCLKQR